MQSNEETNVTFVQAPESEHLVKAKFCLNIIEHYFLPVLIYFGIIGNCLSVYVILKTKLRKLSSSYYLLTLSISDTIFLCTLSIQWMSIASHHLDLFRVPAMCQVIIYLSDICGSLSVWIIVALTGERFVAVIYPLKSKYICTVRRAKMITSSLVAFIAVVYSPLTLITISENTESTGNRTVCVPRADMHQVASALNFFDTVFTCLIPMCSISVLNAIICRNIWFFSHMRRKMTYTQGRALDGDHFVIKSKSVYRLTKMILIVSTVWLGLNSPSYAMRFLAHLQALKIVNFVDEEYVVFTVIQRYFQILFYTNFAITFVLYCISGRNFRKAAASLFCSPELMRLFNKSPPVATERNHSTELLTYQSTVRSKRFAKSEERDVAI